MQASNKLTQPGDTITEDFGPANGGTVLRVTTTLHEDGIAYYVTDGVQRIAELCKTLTVREHAAGYYRLLRECATAGKRIYQIVAEAAALVEMMGIDTARTEGEIAEAINAEVNAHQAEVVIPAHNATVQAVAEVMAGTAQTGGWYGARKQAQRAATFGRKVRPTRTRVHCKPPTPAQLDRMRQHRNGVVTCADGQPWTLLEGIVQRGHADEASIVYQPGTQKIRSVRLNTRGYALANDYKEVAA